MLTVARALVLLETGEFVWNKELILGEFQKVIGGEYEELVTLAHTARYAGTTDEAECYKSLCKQLTGFENHLLEILIDKGLADGRFRIE